MNEEEKRQRIQAGRDFIRPTAAEEDEKTDQELKKKQPPLVKAPMRQERMILARDFSALERDNDFLHIINTRRSHRIYAGKPMNILQLSYLLWCAQGIEGIRGKSYATLRTVPCGGARHEFECYMILRNVKGLKDGCWHYLPWYHAAEFLHGSEHLKEDTDQAVLGQVWADKANVLFVFSYVCCRAEWRYGTQAARMVMNDMGHVSENLYLAGTSLGLGVCGIGAIDGPYCDRLFELDGKEEFSLYAVSVGTIDAKDLDREEDIYAFVREQGL